jgi:hypothetical protein
MFSFVSIKYSNFSLVGTSTPPATLPLQVSPLEPPPSYQQAVQYVEIHTLIMKVKFH